MVRGVWRMIKPPEKNASMWIAASICSLIAGGVIGWVLAPGTLAAEQDDQTQRTKSVNISVSVPTVACHLAKIAYKQTCLKDTK